MTENDGNNLLQKKGDDMLESSVFDLWADTYEEEVDTADKNNVYPFAGLLKVRKITRKG
jgi:hypothetical protein